MTNKLKPFDLEAALRGEPVMLRDGSKAFVRHHETEFQVLYSWCLFGVVAHDSAAGTVLTWTKQGHHFSNENNLDIIGMYPKTHIINGIEVPAPETSEPELDARYYVASPTRRYFHSSESWDDSAADKYWLKRGLIFLSQEDAIANAKAMLGIDPYRESEE